MQITGAGSTENAGQEKQDREMTDRNLPDKKMTENNIQRTPYRLPVYSDKQPFSSVWKSKRTTACNSHHKPSRPIQGGAKKTGLPSHCKYSEIPRPNWVEIGELLQYNMLNTVINFLFKNFIVLWRYLAKTQLLSFIHIVQIDLSITQYLCFR